MRLCWLWRQGCASSHLPGQRWCARGMLSQRTKHVKLLYQLWRWEGCRSPLSLWRLAR